LPNENQKQLNGILAEIQEWTAKANSAPDRSAYRERYQKVNNLRHKARGLAVKHGMDIDLPPLPVNPFLDAPAPPTVDQVLDQHIPALTPAERTIAEETAFRLGIVGELQDVAEPAMEKAGPGPYVKPTSADILAELAARQHHHVEEPPQDEIYAHHVMRSPCAEDCIHPDHHHQVELPEASARTWHLEAPEPPPSLHTAIRRLRQDTARLLVLMEEAEPQDRADHHGSLQVLYAYVGQALELVGEAAIPEAS